jgi:hypothetical protein
MVVQTIDENLIRNLFDGVQDLKNRIKTLESLPTDDLEIKTTAGDFATADSWVGRRVVNTNDNTYKIFFNGAWQLIA